jgi:DUF4097 and DUF4098 domain-containing protein YvlB
MYRLSLISLAGAALLFGQMQDNRDKELRCGEGSRDAERSHCEMRESTMAPVSKIAIDPGTNGGVSVKGWRERQVLVRAKVEARSDTADAAKILASQVRVTADAGRIRAEGPETRDRQQWSVSFEIFLPQRTDLEVKAHNGGIKLQDVEGDLSFKTVNGGVRLSRIAGKVHGGTTNGGIHLDIAGANGEIDVATTNGGVNIELPANFSARLEMATTNGSLDVDAPGVSIARSAREFRGTVGSGGPLIRAVTTNGGVKIRGKRG